MLMIEMGIVASTASRIRRPMTDDDDDDDIMDWMNEVLLQALFY